jgi:hypothetical protein
MANKKLDLTKNVQRIAARQAPQDDRRPTIAYPVSTRAPAPELPAQAGALSERLQEIARQYIGARQRSGEALLDAARCLSEARAEAQHGEWQIFLEATSTTADTAERLINIYNQAIQNPQFAESIRTNWIGQSVAALLARPSTPPEVVGEVLASPEPPTVAEVQKQIRQARHAPVDPQPADVQNPQIADFEDGAKSPTPRIIDMPAAGDQPAATALDVLREVAATLADLVGLAKTLPVGEETERALERIERSVAALRRALRAH